MGTLWLLGRSLYIFDWKVSFHMARSVSSWTCLSEMLACIDIQMLNEKVSE